MEILFLTYNSADASSFYRSAGIAKDLRKKTPHNITVAQWPDVPLNWSFLNQSDLVMFQRPFSRDALALCQFIKQCNIPLWADWDDDLFHLNPENPAYELYADEGTRKAMAEILRIADVVTVPTDELAKVLEGVNKNIVIIPNAFNDTIFKRPDILSRRTNNVIWRGPKAHEFDLRIYQEAIDQATDIFSDHRFIFMGFSPWFLNGSSNKAHIAMQDIIPYFKTLLDHAPACLHIPLGDNTFNRCRSNVAYLEASYAGAVAIVPEWWDVPGALKYTDPKSYYEALKAVLSGEVDIAVQNKISWEYIQDELLLSKINILRFEVIESLL